MGCSNESLEGFMENAGEPSNGWQNSEFSLMKG
jgi:hypothetical protein